MMKPVRLKPNSVEFADEPQRKPHCHQCDMPGCTEKGDYRAPKDRSLSEHYAFCRTHVAQYNAAWNYFSGMNPGDVEHYMTQALYGFRPTRPFSDWAGTMDELEEKIHAFRYGNGAHHTRDGKSAGRKTTQRDERTPERDALKVLGLDETLNFDAIKTRYKQLAKQLHPDLNPGNTEAEELLKQVNMAYTILRVAFARADA